MKKINIILLLVILTISLTGCQLAVTEGTDNSTDFIDVGDLNMAVPIEFKFKVYDETSESGYKDVSEYIYYSWLGSDDLTMDSLVIHELYGSSMVAITLSSGTYTREDDEGNSIRNNVIYFEADVYFSKQNPISGLLPTITFMREDGSTYEQFGTGLATNTNVSISEKYETLFSNGNMFTIEYQLNFKSIDMLKTIEIREYDMDDVLLNITEISENTLLEELTQHEDTAYIFIIETYEDQEGLEYTERLYYFEDTYIYYKYKFTNDSGFLIPNYLVIQSPS